MTGIGPAPPHRQELTEMGPRNHKENLPIHRLSVLSRRLHCKRAFTEDTPRYDTIEGTHSAGRCQAQFVSSHFHCGPFGGARHAGETGPWAIRQPVASLPSAVPGRPPDAVRTRRGRLAAPEAGTPPLPSWAGSAAVLGRGAGAGLRVCAGGCSRNSTTVRAPEAGCLRHAAWKAALRSAPPPWAGAGGRASAVVCVAQPPPAVEAM